MAVWTFYLHFRKSMLFHFLYHEKQEIFSSPAKGGQMNHRNHDTSPGHNGPPKPAARRDYKDSVFRMLFRDRTNLLSLYNAVNQTSYTDPEELAVITLENAVYMNMKNDVAFLMDFRLNLYEHQSTWNPNMPLRDLIYVAKEYQVLTKDQTLYSSSLIRLPTPRFVVFYNGSGMTEESCILRLSDAYQSPEAEPELELKVRVLKIAPEANRELLEACQSLKEYMLFVEQVRKYAAFLELNEAVDRAVNECIRDGILSDFLSKHKAEVIAVSIFEYDEEREIRLIRQDEFRQGQQNILRNQVHKKLQKGKSPAVIADELELEPEVVETLIQELRKELSGSVL